MKLNRYQSEYLELSRRLASMSAAKTPADVDALKAAKLGVCQQWRAACKNHKQFKAQLAEAHREMLPADQRAEIGERLDKAIADLHAAAAGKHVPVTADTE